MDFLINNLTILLFCTAIIAGFIFIRFIKKRKFKADDLLTLVWQSVAISLTLTYVIGLCDFVFSNSSHFNFKSNDVAAIAIPGGICLAILAGSVYYKYISKSGHRGKKQ